MFSFDRIILAVLALHIFSGTGFAQAPGPLLGTPTARTPMPDTLLDTVTLPTRTVEPQDNWRIAADLGFPTGLRLQRRIGDSDAWGELGIGMWWVVPYASACLRQDITLMKRERNLFALRPGVSATLTLIEPIFGVGLDCECIWQHTFNNKVSTELGFRFGMSGFAIVTGRSRDRTAVIPVPIVCLMWSWQF